MTVGVIAAVIAVAVVLIINSKSAPQDESAEPAPPEETAAIEESPFDKPFHFSESLDENGFWIGVRALDYVELFDYKALHIPAQVHTITDEALQKEIDTILDAHSTRIEITVDKLHLLCYTE